MLSVRFSEWYRRLDRWRWCGGPAHSQLSPDTEEIFTFSCITLGKELCTIPSSISTDFDRNMSSPVPAHTAATVLVWCAGESTTRILTVATPSTSMLVLFAAPSVRLDGDRCSLLHLMSLHTFSLITQCDTPVSARAFTVTARGLSLLVAPLSARVTLTLTLGTDFRSSLLDVCRTYPSNCAFDIAFVEPVCGGWAVVVAAGRSC